MRGSLHDAQGTVCMSIIKDSRFIELAKFSLRQLQDQAREQRKQQSGGADDDGEGGDAADDDDGDDQEEEEEKAPTEEKAEKA